MALVAAQDWPKNDMDARQQPRVNDQQQHNQHSQQSSGPPQFSYQQQQPSNSNPYQNYPQQPSPWMNMNMANMAAMNHLALNGHAHAHHAPAQTYFPPMSYYPQQFPHQQHQQAAFGQAPLYDPNAQFAQWYQHMMFNAQAQAQVQQLSVTPGPVGPSMQQQQQQSSPQSQSSSSQGRSRSGSQVTHSPAGTPTDYFSGSQLPFSNSHSSSSSSNGNPIVTTTNSRFSTPSPAPSSGQQSSQSQPSSTTGNYQGFHPYRRPERGERERSRTVDSSPNTGSGSGLNVNSIPFQPPYARQDAAGSSTSVNSTSNSSQRSRTNSGNSASGGSVRGPTTPHASQHSYSHTPRVPSSSSSQGSAASGSAFGSTLSSAQRSASSQSSASPPAVSSNGIGVGARTQRPSPLSQGSTTFSSVSERRKSRDDSDLAAMMSSQSLSGLDGSASGSNLGHGPRNGLKGRLRRALSFNAVQTLKEEDEDELATPKTNKKKEKGKDVRTGPVVDADDDADDAGEEGSVATKKTKKSLRLFNARFNASTDNISLSSTVSSASVMIRKLGSMGRLARRNSLAGITSLFKDKEKKDKDKDGDGVKKSKSKAGKVEASVSHVTAETERSNDWSPSPGMEGLSPAAEIARRHTLKSNAEAAARLKQQQEQAAAAAAAAAASASAASATTSTSSVGASQVAAWDRNTTNRHGGMNGGPVREDGMRVVVEEDSDEDEPLRRRVPGAAERRQGPSFVNDLGEGSGSDEESTWRGHGEEDDDDEDVTIRIGSDKNTLGDIGSADSHSVEEDDVEPWAVDVRRSIERTRKPAKGILKFSSSYSQELYEAPSPAFAQSRVRANSYDSVPNPRNEAGPLARMPSPDPDHIDGLHKHHPSNTTPPSAGDNPPFLPPLSFESGDSPTSSVNLTPPPVPEKHAFFNHPAMNNSEPALSTMMPTPPTLTHRSATTPGKRLAFATNLSIYDTFSATAYDRRSEPATWSRLTPTLAQRIKEELNSYKMEEMEVHSASRIQ